MNGIRRPETKHNIQAMATGFAAFVFVFLFEALLNLKFKTMTEFPSEYQELFYGATLSGRDWTNIISYPYVNIIPSLVYSFIFKYVNHGPLFLWQCFLLVMVFCRSLPAFIATYISVKHYYASSVYAFFIGVVCSFCIPGRTNCLTKESFTIMFIWLLVWLLVEYVCTDNRRSRIILVMLFPVMALLAMLTDIDCFEIFVALFAFVLFEFLSSRMSKVELGANLFSFAICIGLYIVIFMWFTKCAMPDANLYKVSGTFQQYQFKFIKEFKSLTSFSGWLGLFDSVICSFWELAVYSMCMIPFVIVTTLSQMHKQRGHSPASCEADDVDFDRLYGAKSVVVISLILAIIFQTLVISFNYAQMHIHHYSPYVSLFELKDFWGYIGPIIFFFILSCRKNLEIRNKTVIVTLVSFIISTVYVYFVIFFPTRKISDYDLAACFSNNDSLLLSLASTTTISGITLFLLFIVIFCVIAFLVFKRVLGVKELALFFSAFFVFQYLLNYFVVDGGFEKEISYFNYSNVTFRLNNIWPNEFNKVKQINYIGDYSGYFIISYVLKDVTVVPGFPEDAEEAFIVTSNDFSKMTDKYDILDYYYCKYDADDSNEYFYVKGDDLVSSFQDVGIPLKSVAHDYYMDLNLNRVYKCLLGRSIDKQGREYWIEQLDSEEVTYKEIIYGVLMGPEFEAKNYSNRDIVKIFYRFFFDLDLYDDESVSPSFDDLKFWCGQLEENKVPFNEFIEAFFQHEDCIIDDLRWD